MNQNKKKTLETKQKKHLKQNRKKKHLEQKKNTRNKIKKITLEKKINKKDATDRKEGVRGEGKVQALAGVMQELLPVQELQGRLGTRAAGVRAGERTLVILFFSQD